MNLQEFDYVLPKGRIAQFPLLERSASRLMVLHRETKTWEHRRFTDLKECFREGDVLVFNDTKVIPARLIGRRERTGGKVECLLMEQLEKGVYKVLCRPSHRVKVGNKIIFPDSELVGEVLNRGEGKDEGDFDESREYKIIQFNNVADPEDHLRQIGKMPLPPYIKRETVAMDEERYQTIYAKNEGAIAAPTAGLHFTDPLFEAIITQGVRVVYVTLHVGAGTFIPVRSEDPGTHRLWPEKFVFSEEAADELNQIRTSGGRIFSVGTTTCRVLETVVGEGGKFHAAQGETDLFILPGFRFRAADALLTNFHLPRTTLLMLVSAFATREWILEAYQEAIREGYRFYSYGDAMLIL